VASPNDAIGTYTRAVRRRIGLTLGARALAVACGAAAVALVLAALWVGPVATRTQALLAFAACALVGVLAALIIALPAARSGRNTVWALVAARSPTLASRLRSALELGTRHDDTSSAQLVQAHAAGVAAELRALPPQQVLGRDAWRHPALRGGLVAVAAAVLAGAATPVRDGVGALLHPAHTRSDGERVAKVVAKVNAKLTFPSYLQRAPEAVVVHDEIVAPRGTTVELQLEPRLSWRRAEVTVGEQTVKLTHDDEHWRGRFVARDDAPVTVRVWRGQQPYTDAQARALRVLPDEAPVVTLDERPEGHPVRPEDTLRIGYQARDELGLALIELVARPLRGQERRRRLWSALAADSAQREHAGELEVTPAQLGAMAGDTLAIHIEARDGDTVSGPNVGVSPTITIEVTSDDRVVHAPMLRALLDQGIGVLADRIEAPKAEGVDDARERTAPLQAEAQAWCTALDAFSSAADTLRDRESISAITIQTRRLLARERAALHNAASSAAQLERADRKLVAQHEDDVLTLADMLGQLLVDEARSLTDELSEMKDEMRRLLTELQNNPDGEALQSLLDEIARAERRLRELARNFSRMSTRVPSEFINRDALDRESSQDALSALREAAERGDIDEAMRRLDALSSQIDELASHVDSGADRFRASRFGPRDAAMARARGDIESLAAEQASLAERSHAMLDKLSKRARSQGQPEANLEGLAQQAHEIARELERVDRSPMSPLDQQSLDGTRARVDDTGDALESNDLSQARSMAKRAGAQLERLTHSTETEARMFPGHEGETSERAEALRNARKKLDQLQDAMQRQAPSLEGMMGGGDRAQLAQDAERQGKARGRASQLEQRLAGDSDGRPLAPGAANQMREARMQMSEAERALREGRTQDASTAQDEASEQLRQLAEQLGQQSQPQRTARRRDGGDGGSIEGPVEIPDADAFMAPTEQRRRVLDAMREDRPAGFEDALGRYYEELLR
jgi:hypothetical protein